MKNLKTIQNTIITFTCMLILVGCGLPEQEVREFEFGDTQADALQRDIDLDESISFQEIKSRVLAPNRCTTCHADFTNSESAFNAKLVAGSPESTSLYLRMKNGNMPMGGPSVSTADLQLLEDYINQL